MSDQTRGGSISIVVPTRNRPGQLKTALKSVLVSSLADFELVVVDQSTDDETARLVNQIAEQDPRVRFVQDPRKGLSRARNLGISVSRGELIVFTDDDCEVERDWLAKVVDSFREDPTAGIVFGSVIPAPCDEREGFIVGYIPPRPRKLQGRMGKLFDGGIGANMALRRTALDRSAGFDELLGAGGYFASCEDGDMAYRILKAGYALIHRPDARVIHHGFRDWASGSALTRTTYLAVAAAYTKHLRRGDFVAALLLLQQLGFAATEVGRSLFLRRRPLGVGRFISLFKGMWRSFELDIDAAVSSYRSRS